MRVNGISREAAQEDLEQAFALWRQRSRQSWTIDYGADATVRQDDGVDWVTFLSRAQFAAAGL